ncbi:putative uncharacterized protein FLJ46204 [Scylla paramamosain]|uniref:putative uncharacterized protein FLJ46204 n=1 Tax=Scylla paramamosain TaxID=85552 RepID=UPI003083289A
MSRPLTVRILPSHTSIHITSQTIIPNSSTPHYSTPRPSTTLIHTFLILYHTHPHLITAHHTTHQHSTTPLHHPIPHRTRTRISTPTASQCQTSSPSTPQFVINIAHRIKPHLLATYTITSPHCHHHLATYTSTSPHCHHHVTRNSSPLLYRTFKTLYLKLH